MRERETLTDSSLSTHYANLLDFSGPILTIVVSVLTIAALMLQTIILWRQNRIQETQLRLSEHVSLSAEPIIRGDSGKLRVNFQNEGKGTTKETTVRYSLKERGSNSVLTGTGILQSMGPGKQADLSVPEIGPSNMYHRYETMVISWQGKGADDRPFNGSREVGIRQFRYE